MEGIEPNGYGGAAGRDCAVEVQAVVACADQKARHALDCPWLAAQARFSIIRDFIARLDVVPLSQVEAITSRASSISLSRALLFV